MVHVVHDKNGTPVSTAPITNAIASINSYFAPIGVSFKICEYRDIYNFTYDTLSAKFEPEVLVKYHVAQRINLFLVSTFPDKPNACGHASLGGITYTSKVDIVIKKGCENPGVVAHEMGHYFGLPHTFEGSGTELVNGSNCKVAGDGVCDTPADPYVDGEDTKNYVDENCVFINTRKDANGQYYDPDVSNIMSYYPCNCGTFTQGQYEKMVNHYLTNPVIW